VPPLFSVQRGAERPAFGLLDVLRSRASLSATAPVLSLLGRAGASSGIWPAGSPRRDDHAFCGAGAVAITHQPDYSIQAAYPARTAVHRARRRPRRMPTPPRGGKPASSPRALTRPAGLRSLAPRVPARGRSVKHLGLGWGFYYPLVRTTRADGSRRSIATSPALAASQCSERKERLRSVQFCRSTWAHGS